MTFAHDRNLQTGIATSVGIHILLLLILVSVLSRPTASSFLQIEKAKPKEPEVTLLFPDQIIPKLVKKEPQPFIRTTQNKESTIKPKNAAFQSDKNTVAASEKPPVPGALHPMPTLDGAAPDIRELINRDYKDGEIKNDSVAAQSTVPPPTTAPTPPPQVAKATATPLEKMMEEMDKEQTKDGSQLPLEIRKAESNAQTPPAPTPAPQVRTPEDMPPAIVKAVPVDDPIEQITPDPEKNAFSPFTRTSKTDGSVSQEGANAVNAEATPMGTYMRQVTGAVEKKWHLYIRLGKDAVTFGRVRFRFYVDEKGVPQDLKILSDAKDADPRMRDLTLRAILNAEIPPIPPELLQTLDDGRVKIEYEAIIY